MYTKQRTTSKMEYGRGKMILTPQTPNHKQVLHLIFLVLCGGMIVDVVVRQT
jgi:hypothetical protein